MLEAPEHQQLLEVMKWTSLNIYKFFHSLHQEGLWIPREVAQKIVRYGFAFCET